VSQFSLQPPLSGLFFTTTAYLKKERDYKNKKETYLYKALIKATYKLA